MPISLSVARGQITKEHGRVATDKLALGWHHQRFMVVKIKLWAHQRGPGVGTLVCHQLELRQQPTIDIIILISVANILTIDQRGQFAGVEVRELWESCEMICYDFKSQLCYLEVFGCPGNKAVVSFKWSFEWNESNDQSSTLCCSIYPHSHFTKMRNSWYSDDFSCFWISLCPSVWVSFFDFLFQHYHFSWCTVFVVCDRYMFNFNVAGDSIIN